MFRKVGFVSATLLMLLMSIMVAPSASAYFWTDDPTSWDSEDEPPPVSEDGHGDVIILNNEADADLFMTGGPIVLDPHYITYGEEEEGYVLMFVVAYDIRATPYYAYDTMICINLTLNYHMEIPGWHYANGMEELVQTVSPFKTDVRDEGWLYVWMDVDYEEEPQFQLVLTADMMYYSGYEWIHLQSSPTWLAVYYEVEVVD